MQWPLTDPDTLFEARLHDLPPETTQMARACKAFVRAKKVKTPAPRLRVVFVYCGLDKSVREVAGTLTALYEAITDQAVAERVRAWGPWGHALLRRRRPRLQADPLPAGRRFVVIAARSMQAPGATGTDHRRPIALALLALQCLAGRVSDVHTGDTRTPLPVAPGAGAVGDRGEAQCPGRQAAVAPGADRLVRRHPCRVVLRAVAGAPLPLCVTWKRQTTATLRTLAGTLGAAGGPQAVRGWVQA